MAIRTMRGWCIMVRGTILRAGADRRNITSFGDFIIIIHGDGCALPCPELSSSEPVKEARQKNSGKQQCARCDWCNGDERV
jgi:hypothetical protein